MNAIDLLKNDHRTVEDLFVQAEDEPPAKQQQIFKKIKGELDTHPHIEETVFYPALQEKGTKPLVKIVLEGIEEHKQIKMFLKEIAALKSRDETFEAKLKVLIEDTRHHVKEEENEMFPKVRRQFTAEALEKLGTRMEASKKRYQTRHGIKPVPPKKGVLDSLIDKAASIVGLAPEPKRARARAASGGK